VLTSRWAAAAKSAAIDAVDAVVPLHKDFHAGHVLVGDHTCVIDFDEARMGDPAFDVAHFCTYLDQLGASHLVEWFLDSYSAASGWVDKGSLAPFRAYTCLKIAKQAVAGSGPFRDVDRAERLDIADAAIDRGTSWVDTPWQGWS
jgi:aminoglycoside phosphotransferase (APT) family kinase protein